MLFVRYCDCRSVSVPDEGSRHKFILPRLIFSLQNVKGTVTNARRIDGELEKKVIFSCLEELKQFPKR